MRHLGAATRCERPTSHDVMLHQDCREFRCSSSTLSLLEILLPCSILHPASLSVSVYGFQLRAFAGAGPVRDCANEHLGTYPPRPVAFPSKSTRPRLFVFEPDRARLKRLNLINFSLLVRDDAHPVLVLMLPQVRVILHLLCRHSIMSARKAIMRTLADQSTSREQTPAMQSIHHWQALTSDVRESGHNDAPYCLLLTFSDLVLDARQS
ncbi:hypothetical protein BCR34DRAFT_375853 [Clohesyomyces aquaticus]|uniref:Uncharacterized protein n=1 Tax=Clohesyomyces aquaticus TaxID=1231657 RepID=A0A1Y1ZG43_9PLEO|nr:hypothetical protein BCR34DRAFT_375853 [Clohesyomyces aquaticus]